MNIDPVAQLIRRNTSGINQSMCVWLWRYFAIGWFTGVYHVRAYPDGPIPALEGTLSAFVWPLYWFIETILIFGGA